MPFNCALFRGPQLLIQPISWHSSNRKIKQHYTSFRPTKPVNSRHPFAGRNTQHLTFFIFQFYFLLGQCRVMQSIIKFPLFKPLCNKNDMPISLALSKTSLGYKTIMDTSKPILKDDYIPLVTGPKCLTNFHELFLMLNEIKDRQQSQSKHQL